MLWSPPERLHRLNFLSFNDTLVFSLIFFLFFLLFFSFYVQFLVDVIFGVTSYNETQLKDLGQIAIKLDVIFFVLVVCPLVTVSKCRYDAGNYLFLFFVFSRFDSIKMCLFEHHLRFKIFGHLLFKFSGCFQLDLILYGKEEMKRLEETIEKNGPLILDLFQSVEILNVFEENRLQNL